MLARGKTKPCGACATCGWALEVALQGLFINIQLLLTETSFDVCRSAYNLYFRDEQAKLRALRGGARKRSGGESCVRIVAHKWNKVDDTTKAHYVELAAKDKTRYAMEIVKWKQQQERRPQPIGTEKLSLTCK